MFQQVAAYGRYRFSIPDSIDPDEDAAYICENSRPLPAPDGRFDIKRFARYSAYSQAQ